MSIAPWRLNRRQPLFLPSVPDCPDYMTIHAGGPLVCAETWGSPDYILIKQRDAPGQLKDEYQDLSHEGENDRQGCQALAYSAGLRLRITN